MLVRNSEYGWLSFTSFTFKNSYFYLFIYVFMYAFIYVFIYVFSVVVNWNKLHT